MPADHAIAAVDWVPLTPRLVKEGYGDADSVWPGELPSLLVRVTAGDGTVGFGEATTQTWYLGETRTQMESVLALYAHALEGQPVDNIAGAHAAMLGCYAGAAPGGNAARAGVDMALHDLAGKLLGVPAASLLGGRHRDRLDQLTNLYHATPEAMAEGARDFVAQGFKALKIKVGESLLAHGWSRGGLTAELDKLEAALDAVGPEIMIDADANQGWRNAGDAAAALRAFAGRPNLSIEQPLAYENYEGHAQLRRIAGLPVILDEPVRAPETVMQLIRSQACDRVVIKLNRVGGLHPASRIATICEAAGIGVSVDTNPFTLLGDSASAQLASAIPTHYPADCEGHVSFLTLAEGIVSGGVTFEGGRAVVPRAPGLGVEVDWARAQAVAEAGT
jgi:L-alanine-DL-glutamate epimerase-like enolase superfamily enzyme